MTTKEELLKPDVSNPLELRLSNGRKIQFRVIHVANPQVGVENPSGCTEDYYVLQEENQNTRLIIRVSSRSPLILEQLDTANAKGAAFLKRVEGYLKNGK